MQIPIFIVDAFTEQLFFGNPAAVCLLEDKLEEDLHQKIATEMNLSETAFVRKLHPTDDFAKSSCFGLRWFTPTNEVPLCGHATLASAAVLFCKKKNINSSLTFVTLSGELNARQAEDHIILDLPLYLTYPQESVEVEELVKVILESIWDDILNTFVMKLKVNTQALLPAEKTGRVKGLILTLKGRFTGKPKGYDFYSRYFAPWNGVPEDPVTGSAHAVLSSYWSQQLGKKEMLAFQCSSRGGELKISLRNDGRVDIGGHAVIVLTGNLTLKSE
uniref:Phenazine biosynthesis like protein domain containing n=1 Tax=Sphenodon punctatus TaxID=8508 RepID=A0A8D0G2X4_SPHPU